MPKRIPKKILMCDFETTVFGDESQDATEVWAAACVELGTEDVKIFHSIEEQYNYFESLNCTVIAYYHNLKFDGAFWLSYLLTDLKFKQAYEEISEGEISWKKVKDMRKKSFRYTISDKGQWYSITIRGNNNKVIEIRDSLKLLPFSVSKIGKSFGTKHKKLEMEYKGFRYAGCKITEEEQQYIANDVLVVKEALEIMFDQGHTQLTIGSCCLDEYKKLTRYTQVEYWEIMFPDLTQIHLDKSIYGYDNADSYIRKSYKGGWCYLVYGKENKIFSKGTTADVNSLYPSMMHSDSGNRYPVGQPVFWSGNYIPEKAKHESKYYFVRIRTRFNIKPGKLPFIQIKDNIRYKSTEYLLTSDVYDKRTHKYYDCYYQDGDFMQSVVTMTLTCTDYELLKEHYILSDCTILDGCWFCSEVGIFDNYINKYKKLKMESTGAVRELAKLFLNNLYGKLATSTDSSFKVAYVKENGVVGFRSIKEGNKKAVYIAAGSAVTSYARNFTIRAAQANYHGVNKPGFIYADTDSIHCDLPPDQIKGITVDDKEFCCWKLESCWDQAVFVRQKTYIEHVTAENLEPVEHPYYNVKCAGMPDRAKNLFIESFRSEHDGFEIRNEYEKDFLSEQRTLSDFKVGLVVPGKLIPKRIKGGVLLVDTSFEMRPQ